MNIYYKIILFFCLFNIGSILISAQHIGMEHDDEEVSRKGMWYVIPEANFWFGNYSIIELSPQIAYHLSNRWSLGTGLNYNFNKELETYYTSGYTTHLFGARVFSRFTIIRNAEQWMPVSLFNDLFAHLELQVMNIEREHFSVPSYPDNGRFWTEQIYVGVGISQNITPMSSYSFLLLWDLNRNIFTPYGNPVYRIGLNIYLGNKDR